MSRLGFICVFSLNLACFTVFSDNAMANELKIAADNNPDTHSDLNMDTIVSQANIANLADSPGWFNLLHYTKLVTGVVKSQTDDQSFFLAASGMLDPAAELEANIRGFWSDFREQPSGTELHPQCRFPARYFWLKQQLDKVIDSRQQVDKQCDGFVQWQQKFNAQSITLLFPGMYLNNPASMFGHTFLRFDQAEQSPLLHQTLSYAAYHDETDSFPVYAWKGITGGYPGRFYMQPYYETLQEYSDIEQRDIWEYKLNLNSREIKQLVRHLWEIKEIYFGYYFLRENCSFRLLTLMDVAREGINMSQDSHPVYAVPVDIVRDFDRAGLISERNYRPAGQTRVVLMMQQMNDTSRKITQHIIEYGPDHESSRKYFNRLDEKEKYKILALSNQLLTLQSSGEQDVSDIQYQVLHAISQLEKNANTDAFEFVAIPPEQGHGSARISASGGEQTIKQGSVEAQKRQHYVGFELRPVFHDSLDPSAGFIEGATVSFLETKFRWFEDDDKLKLSKLNIMTLRSLLPVNQSQQISSKYLSLEFDRRQLTIDKYDTVFKTELGLGYSIDFSDILMYGMLQTRLDYSDDLVKHYGFYMGAELGALYQTGGLGMSAQFDIKIQSYEQYGGQPGDIELYSLAYQQNLNKNHALRMTYELQKYDRLQREVVEISYLFYF